MVEKKIQTCKEVIVLIAKTILGVFGTGFAATMYFADKITAICNKEILTAIVVVEMIGMGVLSLHIIVRLGIIQNLNLEERQ